MHHVFYADEVRSFADVDRPGELSFKPVEAELADKLIEQLSTDKFDAEQYKDEYRERVLRAVEQKVAGEEITVSAEAPQAQIIDLFEALKRSLKSEPDVERPADEPAKPEVAKAGPRASSRKKATG
jgi:DNA end-binding protein Ku